MGIYIKGNFKNPYPNCDECIFGEIIQCEATTRKETYDYEVNCPLSEIELDDDCISKKYMLNELSKMADDWVINNAVQHGIYEAHNFIKDAQSIVATKKG